jgi:F-type H+-transporting ATPase subunit b
MPQLDPQYFAPQLIWLAITFIALYFAMSNFALPKIGDVLEERESKIAGDLAAAKALKEETEKAIAAYEQALAEARAKANAIASKTREDLSARLAEDRAAIEKQLADRTTAAEKRISDARGKSLAQVEAIAAETAGTIVERVIGVKTDAAEATASVKQIAG